MSDFPGRGFRELPRGEPVGKVLTLEWMSMVQEDIKALAQGRHITVEGGMTRRSGEHGVNIGAPAERRTWQRTGRFRVWPHPQAKRLYISPGSVARIDPLDPVGLVVPAYPKVGEDPLDEPRWLDLADLEEGQTYVVALILTEEEQWIELREVESAGDEVSEDDEAAILELAEFQVSFVDETLVVENLEQFWESDVIWPKSESSSSSLLSSESSSEASSSEASSSIGSDEGSSIGSDGGSSGGSDGGSDKSTAIVPASWSKQGYTALFTEEAPDVRFHDVMKVKITGRVTWAEMDPRYVEVCAEGTIWVQGVAADRPFPVGVRVCGGEIRIECGRWRRPGEVTVSLTGIRKGFVNLRFPDKTRAEFEANERFLNMNKPRK